MYFCTQQNQPFIWPFIRDYPSEPLSKETFNKSHSTILYHRPSTMILSILPLQSTCFTVFFAQPLSEVFLVYLCVWNTALHTPYSSSTCHYLISPQMPMQLQ